MIGYQSTLCTSKQDLYETPTWCVRAALDAFPVPTLWAVEPSAGHGRWVAELVRRGHKVIAVEAREECRQSLEDAGAASVMIENWFSAVEKFDGPSSTIPYSIVGNPPYSAAVQFCKSALRTKAQMVQYFLRAEFVAGAPRRELFAHHPLTGFGPFDRRPSCDGHGTDRYEYAMFVWEAHRDALPIMHLHSTMADDPPRKDPRQRELELDFCGALPGPT